MINLEDIDKIELQDGLFSTSYIRLKNNKPAIMFDYYLISDKDLRKMVDAHQLQMS